MGVVLHFSTTEDSLIVGTLVAATTGGILALDFGAPLVILTVWVEAPVARGPGRSWSRTFRGTPWNCDSISKFRGVLGSLEYANLYALVHAHHVVSVEHVYVTNEYSPFNILHFNICMIGLVPRKG